MGQTREGPRRVREEWGEALGRGLRPSFMSLWFLGLCKLQMLLTRVKGRARVIYRFCQDELLRSQ